MEYFDAILEINQLLHQSFIFSKYYMCIHLSINILNSVIL